MDKTVSLDVTPKSDKEYEAIINQQIGQMKLMLQKMDEDRHEIVAMRTETDAMLASIMQILKAA